MTTIQNLDQLLDVLRSAPKKVDKDGDPIDAQEYAERHDLPHAHGEIDWTELPTFGGEESDRDGVWSWDEDRLLIGTCSDDLEIVRRDEY